MFVQASVEVKETKSNCFCCLLCIILKPMANFREHDVGTVEQRSVRTDEWT